MAAAETARGVQQRSAIGDLFDTLFSGGKLQTDQIHNAAEEFVGWAMGGDMAQGYHPDLSDEQPGDHRPPPWEPPRWGRGAPPPPPPPVDPDIERRAAVRAAKVALGFAASEPVTVDMVKRRHRELARKHHPDVGGSLAKMQEVNAAAEILLAAL